MPPRRKPEPETTQVKQQGIEQTVVRKPDGTIEIHLVIR